MESLWVLFTGVLKRFWPFVGAFFLDPFDFAKRIDVKYDPPDWIGWLILSVGLFIAIWFTYHDVRRSQSRTDRIPFKGEPGELPSEAEDEYYDYVADSKKMNSQLLSFLNSTEKTTNRICRVLGWALATKGEPRAKANSLRSLGRKLAFVFRLMVTDKLWNKYESMSVRYLNGAKAIASAPAGYETFTPMDIVQAKQRKELLAKKAAYFRGRISEIDRLLVTPGLQKDLSYALRRTKLAQDICLRICKNMDAAADEAIKTSQSAPDISVSQP